VFPLATKFQQEGEITMSNTQVGLGLPLAGSGMLSSLAQNWWMLLLRGIAAIVFGVLAFVWPGITLLSLTILWGAYAISDGAFAFAAGIGGKGFETSARWWLALVGLCGILAGILTFVVPGMTELLLLMYIASWAVVVGVLQVWGAIQLRKEIENEWLLALSGLLSIAVGVLVIAEPGAGALSVVWTIGSFAVLVGCLYIGLAFRLKKFKA
jgi:uncharacterized membrane protein HdeD (DUF308 family)